MSVRLSEISPPKPIRLSEIEGPPTPPGFVNNNWFTKPQHQPPGFEEPPKRIESPGIDTYGPQDVWTSQPSPNKGPSLSSQTKAAWKRGGESIGVDFLWHKVAMGELDEATAVKAEKEFNVINEKNPIAGKNWLDKLWLDTVQMARPMAEGQYKGMKHGTVAAGAAAVAGQMGPQVAFPEEIVTVPGAYAAGQTIGSMKYWSEQGSGLVYKEARKQGLSPKTARYAASIAGPFYAFIEYSQVDKIIPGLGKIKGNILAKAIKVATNTTQEVVEEGVQKLVTDGATSVGKLVEGQIDASHIPDELKKTARNAYEEMKQSVGPMAILQLPGAAVATVESISDVRNQSQGPTSDVAQPKPPMLGAPGTVDTSGLPPIQQAPPAAQQPDLLSR